MCGLYVIPFMNHVVCIHVYTGEDDINKLPEDWENVQNEYISEKLTINTTRDYTASGW